jgi:hypothetical protein
MSIDTLASTVEQLAHQVQNLPDSDLDRPWAWRDYDSEGVRFALFRMYEELRSLAVQLRRERAAAGQPFSSAQHILTQYHAAYRDLQAILVGVNVNQLERAPAEGEWPVQRVCAHIVGADIGFYVAIGYALERHRRGDWEPAIIPDEAWDRLTGLNEPGYRQLLEGPLPDLLVYHQDLHGRLLAEFAGITEDELELPARYWEAEPYSLRFRLHRFDSHMRQHTIQVEKTLAAIGNPYSESRRLLRLIYAALAEVEGALIGAPDTGQEDIAGLTETISSRTYDIQSIIAG